MKYILLKKKKIIIILICFVIILFLIYFKILRKKIKINLLKKFNISVNNKTFNFLYKGKDNFLYPYWEDKKNNVALIFISLNLLKKKSINIDNKLLWSWVIYDMANNKTIFYTETKNSKFPYNNVNMWNV